MYLKIGLIIRGFGFVLVVLGGLCIAFILLSVMITGSWSNAPEIVQIWGTVLRVFVDIPIIGNFTWFFWLLVFVGPGGFIVILGDKIKEKFKK